MHNQPPHSPHPPNPPQSPYQPQQQPPTSPGSGFACPVCHTNSPPMRRSQVSTAGWVVFAVMMVVCFPLFWIGLLIKEEYSVCGTCGFRFN